MMMLTYKHECFLQEMEIDVHSRKDRHRFASSLVVSLFVIILFSLGSLMGAPNVACRF